MATTNKTKKTVVANKSNTVVDQQDVVAERLAGGYGPHGAMQPAELDLRRMVLTCLLWEDAAYIDGQSIANKMTELVAKVDPERVSALAIEARHEQKLRHVPLFLCRQMARLATHKHLVARTLEKVIRRPDELAEFLSLYWKDNGGKKTLSAQVKKGLSLAFRKFNEYQLSKWNRDKEVKLRDVLFLTHAKTQDIASLQNPWGQQPVIAPAVGKTSYSRGEVLRHNDSLADKLVKGTLAIPDTWEVGLSEAKNKEEKCFVWTHLIEQGKLGAFAFLKNLRNMQEVNVKRETIAKGLANIKPDMLLPIDFLKAIQYAPAWQRELEELMFNCCKEFPKLKGWTIFVIDVSGSMGSRVSAKSEFSRMDAGMAMAVLAAEMCEQVSIYATAGSDGRRVHATEKVRPHRGFALVEEIRRMVGRLGGGGIFTRQCLEYIQQQEQQHPDRIIVFSDSQYCDYERSCKPIPFGKRNYIVDVSPHQHGVNYKGLWTAEISGWSEHFLKFIAGCEAMDIARQTA